MGSGYARGGRKKKKYYKAKARSRGGNPKGLLRGYGVAGMGARRIPGRSRTLNSHLKLKAKTTMSIPRRPNRGGGRRRRRKRGGMTRSAKCVSGVRRRTVRRKGPSALKRVLAKRRNKWQR